MRNKVKRTIRRDDEGRDDQARKDRLGTQQGQPLDDATPSNVKGPDQRHLEEEPGSDRQREQERQILASREERFDA